MNSMQDMFRILDILRDKKIILVLDNSRPSGLFYKQGLMCSDEVASELESLLEGLSSTQAREIKEIFIE